MFIVLFCARVRSFWSANSFSFRANNGWVGGFFIKTKCPDASEARVRVREEFDLIVNWLEYC